MDILKCCVVICIESQEVVSLFIFYDYLWQEIMFYFVMLGFDCEVIDNLLLGGSFFLIVECIEEGVVFILFIYGYGDVVCGYDN